ncbi:UNVERIFIED_CONTAM: hypothetical protein FKN15_057303 [Acipenser sinensis]
MGTRSVQTSLSLALILLVQLHGTFGWNWPDQEVYNAAPYMQPPGAQSFSAPRAVFQAKPTPRSVERADLSLSNSVTLDCRKDAMVVTVKRDLFGIGYLVNSADFSVGSAGCSATSSDSVASTVLFSIQLQNCGSSFQVFPDFLSYTNHLYYKPASVGIITRVNIADILLECRYPRRWNVDSSPIKPTWVPFTSTASTEQILDFSLLLMSAMKEWAGLREWDNWSGPRVSSVIYLGDVLHIEASVAVYNHVPLRLYVDSCITTLSGNKDSEHRYAVVDKLGCLMDSKAPDSSSSFTSPALNKLCFDITSFKFQGDSRSLINMTCKLRAVNADKPADASNKACSYQKQTNRDICSSLLPGRWGATGFLPGSTSLTGKWLHKRAAPLDPAGQDPSVQVKEITIGPLTVVHVARDHAVVLSKDSQYHPLQLVEVQELLLLVSSMGVASCTVLLTPLTLLSHSGSSVPVLAVFTVAQALVRCPVGRVP